MSIHICKISKEQTWKLRHEVMWPNKPIDFIKLPNDNNGIHFGLLKNNEVVSVVSLFIENEKAQFRKLATKISEQRSGYGTKLLSYIMNQVKNQNVNMLWCNARVDKVSFYKKFDLIETNNTFSKENVDYVIMEKAI